MALEATELDHRYARAWALRGCSFSLPEGRVSGLVGPNGAGKTTLLHLAVGLLRPTGGTIRTLGASPWANPESMLSEIGFLAQDVPLFRRFTVSETLRFGRAMNPRWDQAGAESRLRRLGIPLDRQVRRLSGGQRSQVALAMALAKRPRLLLLDEPLASLDPLARREFMSELMEAATGDGLTVLLSSHLITDLERSCNHLIVLREGVVELAGDIQELLEDHRLLAGPHLEDVSWLDHVEVLKRSRTGPRTELWTRGSGFQLPHGWTSRPVQLEDLVLVYLAGTTTRTAHSIEGGASR